jgi:hypothetical protein
MADVELIPTYGAIDKGIAYTAPPLAGDTFLYVTTEKADHWTYERSDLSVGLFSLKGEAGRAADGEEAYIWVENDWPRLRNHLRWAQYMANNPPPS